MYVQRLRFSEACVTTRPTGCTFDLKERGASQSAIPAAAYLPTFYRHLAATNQCARPLALNPHWSILLRTDFSEHTRPPHSAGGEPPGPARLSPPRQQRRRRYKHGVPWPSPSAAVHAAQARINLESLAWPLVERDRVSLPYLSI